MFDFKSLNLGKVDTLVDVGAGVGAFLGPALDYFKPTRYLAIEMLPDRAAELRAKYPNDLSSSWICNCAVGEWFERCVNILRTESADSSSLLVIDPQAQDWYTRGPHGMDQAPDGSVTVQTLDYLCGYVHAPVIDLMKMDVQGYEGRAIRGGQATLKRTRALIIEVLFCHHYEGQSTPEEIDWLLTGLGFRLDRWLTDDWNADRSVHLQGDAFYVNTAYI